MVGADHQVVAIHELSTGQARAVAAIRARWPRATLTFHSRPWGHIVELRDAGPAGAVRTIGLARFDADGAIHADPPLRPRTASVPPAAA